MPIHEFRCLDCDYIFELLIMNNDPTNYGANREKRIALRCGPNVENVPEAVLECSPKEISVLQWAVLDGSKSVDSDGESKDDLRYLWSFKSTPGGINLDIVDDLDRAGSPLNNDPSNRVSKAAFQAKMKGLYTVRLIVINNKNVYSNPAECDIEAISDDDLMVKLFWTNKNSDVDLHLIAPDGTYKIVVHAYDLSDGPTTAIVKAFAHADEVNSKQLFMSATDTCWDVFTVDVTDGDGEKTNLVFKAIEPPAAYECERPQQ